MILVALLGKRLMWWAPWTTTDWWWPRSFRGSDEWGNSSVAVVLPPLGTLIFFYGRHLDRHDPEPHRMHAHWSDIKRRRENQE